MTSLLFLIREGFRNIWRNGLMSLAALGTITVALTILGAISWGAYRVHEFARLQPQKFNTIDLFLDVRVERPQTLLVQDRIQQLPDVRAVRLIPKEKAWAAMQAAQSLPPDALPSNPLPDKLEVEARSPSGLARLAERLNDKAQFGEVDEARAASQEVAALLNLSRFVKIAALSLGIGLLIATLFIVQNTIRLTVFARRREIRTMQLVGATAGFIRFPLLMEGVFHGIVGATLASGLIFLASQQISQQLTRLHSPLMGNIPSTLSPVSMAGGLIATGALIGLIGSYLSLRRFLQQV